MKTNSSSVPTLKECKVIGASFGKTNITPFMKYIQNNEGFKNFPKINSQVFCDDLQTYQQALVYVAKDGKNELWYQIAPARDLFIDGNQKIGKPLKKYSCNNHSIEVILAVYGLLECTKQVAEIFGKQSGNELSVHASNSVFGDPWPNVFKSFTLVYRVKLKNGLMSEPRVKVVQEHALLCINLEEELISYESIPTSGGISLSPFIRRSRHEFVNMEVRKYAPSEGINVLAAAYGPEDVTEKVRQYLNEGGSFLRINATNEVFGDSWGGVVKYLVIYYKIDKDKEIYVAVEREGRTLTISKHNTEHILAAPIELANNDLETNQDMIKVHGAMVATSNRTKAMKEYLENNEGAEKTIIMKEGRYEERKCLVLLYSFGEGPLRLFTLKNGEEKSLFETRSKLSSIYLANNKQHLLKVHSSNYLKHISKRTTIFLNFYCNEILVEFHDGKYAIFLQKWKEGENVLKNCQDSTLVSPFNFVKIVMDPETRIQIEGPLMTLKNGKNEFKIALWEVTNTDMRRKLLPQFIRNNVIAFMDETIPDQPGLKRITSLFALSDISIHFN